MKSCSPLSDLLRTVPPRRKVGGSVERHAKRSATYRVTPGEKTFPLSTSPFRASVPQVESLGWQPECDPFLSLSFVVPAHNSSPNSRLFFTWSCQGRSLTQTSIGEVECKGNHGTHAE